MPSSRMGPRKRPKARPRPPPRASSTGAAAGDGAERARRQLIDGLCRSMEVKGYDATTIADIVGQARVSKRTFYEHFPAKEDCFLAAYAAYAADLMAHVAASVTPGGDWTREVAAAVRAYLSMLEARPALTRTFFLSIHAAGPRALRLRRQVLDDFAALARGLVEHGRRDGVAVAGLTPTMSVALVGAVNELVLLRVEEGASPRLGDLAETAVELLRAVLTPRTAEGPRRPRGKTARA